MPRQAERVWVIGSNETLECAVGFRLRADELLSGTPTVTEVTTSALTIANVARNSDVTVIDDEPFPASTAVVFRVSGTPAGTYTVRVSCGTSRSNTVAIDQTIIIE